MSKSGILAGILAGATAIAPNIANAYNVPVIPIRPISTATVTPPRPPTPPTPPAAKTPLNRKPANLSLSGGYAIQSRGSNLDNIPALKAKDLAYL